MFSLKTLATHREQLEPESQTGAPREKPEQFLCGEMTQSQPDLFSSENMGFVFYCHYFLLKPCVPKIFCL